MTRVWLAEQPRVGKDAYLGRPKAGYYFSRPEYPEFSPASGDAILTYFPEPQAVSGSRLFAIARVKETMDIGNHSLATYDRRIAVADDHEAGSSPPLPQE